MKLGRRGLARMLAVGAIAGSLLDGIHTHSGATSYPHPVFWMMAWWTPPLFAGAYALLGAGYALVHREAPRAPAMAWLGGALFAALYFASGYLPVPHAAKLVLLVGSAVLWWLITDRSMRTIGLAIFAAVVGPTVETVLVHAGAFEHIGPDWAGIPIWLPGLYVAAGTCAAPFMAWVGSDARRDP